jgi:hypothetical protein
MDAFPSEITLMAGAKEHVFFFVSDHGAGKMRTYLGIGHQIAVILANQNAGILYSRIREKL